MLVIVSDLHLSDNPHAPAYSGAFEMFKSQVRDMAVRASWRGDGTYRPLERLDLVLLGDTIDFIQTGRWLESDVRPWSDPQSRDFIQVLNSIADGVIEQNGDSIAVLRSLSEPNSIEVPGVDGSGNPTLEHRLGVRTRLHCMVGERDWPLSLTGACFDLLRQKIIQKLGLVNRYDAPFPHQSSDLEKLDLLFKSHGVFAQHGDICDPLSFSSSRQSACWENIVALEIVQQFMQTITESGAEGLPLKFQTELHKTAEMKPVSQIGNRVELLLKNSICSQPLLNKYRRIWNHIVESALETGSRLLDDSDIIGKLRVSLSISGFKEPRINDGFPEFELSSRMIRKAIEITAAANSEIQHVVFGHTHQFQHVALPQCTHQDALVDCTYFNTGSWRPGSAVQAINDQTHLIPPHQQISLLAFYQADQRESRSFESWTGSVAMPNPHVDADPDKQPDQSIRAVRSLVKASAMQRPHFLQQDQVAESNREAG